MLLVLFSLDNNVFTRLPPPGIAGSLVTSPSKSAAVYQSIAYLIPSDYLGTNIDDNW